MRVLTLPKNLSIGGTQVNSVDLANGLTDIGVEVHVLAPDGALRQNLEPAVEWERVSNTAPRAARVATLRRHIESIRPDVIHAFEVTGIIDALYATSIAGDVPVLGTIYSTRVPWYLPETVPLTVGMESLLDFTRMWRSGPVNLLDPPIRPAAVDTGSIDIRKLALDDHEQLAVLVSRLVFPFKKEGIERTLDVMRDLATDGVGLLVVGDGPARPYYEGLAEGVNADLGRKAIVFVGSMSDPTPAFKSADVVLGNGTSALTGLSLGTPAVVMGREGFAVEANPENLDDLAYAGFYGVGTAEASRNTLSATIRAAIAQDDSTRQELAKRVIDRYSLAGVVSSLLVILDEAAQQVPPSRSDLARAIGRAGHFRARRAMLRRKASQLGLEAEQADNYVFGTLRNMALPDGSRFTGRNRTDD